MNTILGISYFACFCRSMHISNTYDLFQFLLSSKQSTILLDKLKLISMAETEVSFLNSVGKIYLGASQKLDVTDLINYAKQQQIILSDKINAYTKNSPNKILFDICNNETLGETEDRILFYQIIYSKHLCAEFINFIKKIDLTMHDTHLSHQLQCQTELSNMFKVVHTKTMQELKNTFLPRKASL